MEGRGIPFLENAATRPDSKSSQFVATVRKTRGVETSRLETEYDCPHPKHSRQFPDSPKRPISARLKWFSSPPGDSRACGAEF